MRPEADVSAYVTAQWLEDHLGDIVPIVIMTHVALISEFHQALAAIDALKSVAGPSVYLPVAE